MKQDARSGSIGTALERIGLVPRLEALDAYLAEFDRWRKAAGLAAWSSPDDLCIAGMIPSLFAAVACRPAPGDRILDLGAGGGIVGLPLASCFPDSRVCLVDKRRKHVVFLHHVVARMALRNVEVRHGRAEEVVEERGFDIVVARAVDPPGASGDIAIRLARPGGTVVRWRRGHCTVRVAVAPGGTELAARAMTAGCVG